MLIAGVKAIPLEVELEKPFSGATYTITKRCTTVVTLTTDDGRSTTIWGGDEKSYGQELANYVNGPLGDVLLGKDPAFTAALWAEMMLKLRDVQSVEPAEVQERNLRLKAIALADIALWTLNAEVAGVPLYRAMGGAYADALPVIGITGYEREGKKAGELKQEVQMCIDMGLAGIKLKVGHSEPQRDIDRVREVRAHAGREFMIACDANMGWSFSQASAFIRGADGSGLELTWIEEPVEWAHQYDGMRRLRERSHTRICSGQNEVLATECKQLILRGCVDVLNTDVTVCGGITPWRSVAAMTTLWPDVWMAHHEEPQIAMHLLATQPNALCVELFPDPMRDPIWNGLPRQKPRMSEGLLHLPTAPGLGIAVDWDFVERWRVD